MSYHAMPFIYLNMGGELIYIVDYRLQQNVQKEKATKVLCDIVHALMNRHRLEMIFEPQEPYSTKALRELFDKITNSNVMRLNKESMERLINLIIMPIKYQALLCKDPSELVLITLNHLNGIKECFSDPTLILEHLNYAQSLFMDNFVETPLWEMACIRNAILNFFLGVQLKITRLVCEHRQLDDGRFVLFSEKNTAESQPSEYEIELPYGAMAPGTVRYTLIGGPLRVETFPVTEKFKVLLEHQERAVSRGTVLGQNMFKHCANTKEKINAKNSTKQPCAKNIGNEVQLLSRLLSGMDNSTEDSLGTFQLDLFENEADGEQIHYFQIASEEEKAKIQIKRPVLEKRTAKKSLSSVVDELQMTSGDKRVSSCPQSRGRGAEILKLMDEATGANSTT